MFSDEQHDAILLAGTQVHKSECKIFDSGASQNVEQDRSMFIVYFPLKTPIPMKQGEGVLYATGVGIVMYNFKRDDSSVYSEPGFALHTPAGNKGMSIISKSSFQDLGFGYLAPPFVGATDFWFPSSWAPNPVPMVLSDAPKNFRSIPMFSHPGSNLSLVPVHSEASVIANNLERWSFTTGQRYDERSAVTGLLNKLVDGGRYAKYHPNMMLSMIHSLSDEHPPATAPQVGVEESKFDDADEPSAQELLDYRLRFPNRQPFLADAAKINSPLHHALHDAALNEALDSSRIDSSLSLLDAERERTLIYCSQLAEAKDRSLRDVDVADVGQALAHGEHAPVIIPPDDVLHVATTSSTTRPATPTAGSSAHVVPPDARHACPVAGCPRRPLSDPRGLRQISHGMNLCCDTCLFTEGRHHTDICDSANRSSTTASSPTPSSGDNSGNDGGSGRPCTGCFRSSCPANVGAPAFHDLCRIHGCVRRATDTEHGNHDVCCDRCSLTSGQFHTALCDAADYDLNAPPSSTVPAPVGTTDVNDFTPGWHNYNSNGKKLDPISEVPSSTDSALLQEEQQHGSVDTSAEESVTGLKLVQHDFSPMTVPSVVANHVIRWGLQAALTVFVACYGLFSASDFENPSSKYGLPVKIIGGVESNPFHAARFEAHFGCPDSDVQSFRDLRTLVVGLESGLIPKFKCDILELTATCFGRCPLRKIHTGVSNLDVARLADDDLFDNWGLRLVAALRPGYVLYEMTPPHSASNKSHSYVTQELVKMEYLVSAYDRFPCDLTGARTSRFRWINVGVRQSDDDAVLPPVDCTAGLLDVPIPFDDCLLPPEQCTRWSSGTWRPTEAIAATVGDEFYTRAVLAGVFVGDDGEPDRSLDKGRKIYSLGGPTPTLTSSNNFHFIDNRSADPNLVGVRQLEFVEILNISGFAPDMNATAFLHSRTEDDALRDVAAAVPPPTLFHLYRAIVNHASAAFLSLRVCSGLEDVYIIDLLPEHDLPCVDDDEFALLAADVVTQAAHCPASSSEEALPSMLRLGTTLTEGLHVSTLGSASSLYLSSIDAVRATGDDEDDDSSVDGAVDTAVSSGSATRQADVRVRPQTRTVCTGSWPPLHAHGSRAWRRKVALVWRYHSIWHHSKEHMEQHLAATGADMYGLEQGDSRYFVWRCNWCALGGMDRFVRDHKTKSLLDYAQNKAPGEMLSLDTGDSNVYSVFRNSRYTVNFVCVVSFYRVTVPLQDNSAPLFLKALEYAVRVFQYLSGNAVREIVSDMFSTYMDTRLIANFRDTKGILLSAMPPYMHWMNHIAEDMIHRNTISTRVRLPGLRGKIVKGRPIDDPSVYHPFATEHSNQCHNHSPYFPLQKRFGFPQTPFQCINRDRVTPPVEMHPFGTVAYMFIEPRYRIHRHSDVAERCYHLCNGAFNYFVHPGVDVPRANVLLRTNAAVPHYLRTASAAFPHCLRTASALLPHCFRTAGGMAVRAPLAGGDGRLSCGLRVSAKGPLLLGRTVRALRRGPGENRPKARLRYRLWNLRRIYVCNKSSPTPGIGTPLSSLARRLITLDYV